MIKRLYSTLLDIETYAYATTKSVATKKKSAVVFILKVMLLFSIELNKCGHVNCPRIMISINETKQIYTHFEL